MSKRCEVSVTDRREAVLSMLRREEPAAVIARRVGVSEPTLYRWRDEFVAAGEAALTSGGRKGSDGRDRRIARCSSNLAVAPCKSANFFRSQADRTFLITRIVSANACGCVLWLRGMSGSQ
jgi:transposase-like protein